VTHVFVSYKVLGGEADNISLVKAPRQINLEEKSSGSVIATIDLSNDIDPSESSLSSAGKRIELKLKKVDTTLQWSGLESGAAQAVISHTSTAAYPSSNKSKKNWAAIDKEIERDFAKEKPEGDAAMNDLFK